MSEDKRVWDKGTPFQSPPSNKDQNPEPCDDDIIWDKGTPFESRQPKQPG